MNNFDSIIKAFKNEEVIFITTDTIPGLACLASSESAKEKIFQLKQREKSKPLSLIVSDLKMAENYAEITDTAKKYLTKKESITVILNKKENSNTIALRITKSPELKTIIQTLGQAIAATSANISTQPPITNITTAQKTFGQKIQYFNLNCTTNQTPSPIIDCTKTPESTIR